ncbi:hypothetical protein ALC60_01330 [Trachymyrmex zeteki]|uniref:Uncharacterized protein n=1 Tax=Mycetomoellerius zeteki TaxID=64791 RepID=A0A151XGY4_9HYME|nr:hypothetical protein ALC60_01330 [Trachymyrmex zeteki]
MDAIKVIKRDQDTRVGERTPVNPRIGPFRSISHRLMPAIRKDGIGCPASGRLQRTRTRTKISAALS